VAKIGLGVTDFEPNSAADALVRLEAVRDAIELAKAEAAAGAAFFADSGIGDLCQVLVELLTDTVGDSALDRHIHQIDAALAAYHAPDQRA